MTDTSFSQEVFESSRAYLPRSKCVGASAKEFMDEQIEFILNHRATQHPFLLQYSQLGLPRHKSKTLYLETLHYFKNLPFYVCAIATLTRDEAVLRSIAFNACDELGLKKSHAELYKDFLIAKGISKSEIETYECLPSTQALNDGICALYSKSPLQKALGGLFADEAMSACMVGMYNDGLIKEGVCKKDRAFWILHMEVEVGHSNAVFNVMEKHLETQYERQMFIAGICQYLHLMEVFWNGVERKVQAQGLK